VLSSAVARIEALPGDALVLDVGGWARPLSRADWVLDLQPFETRGLYGRDGDPGSERFSAETWVRRDMCAREPWPFADDRFDFAVCAHTLEDVRDPVWVCSELSRVARAGYVEVPAVAEEMTLGVQGPWVGWGHHHWLCFAEDGGLTVVMKSHHLVREGCHLPPGTVDGLPPEERVQQLWWEGEVRCAERVYVGPDEFDAFIAGLVERHARPRRRRWRR
jgi:Methyltransferase domain